MTCRTHAHGSQVNALVGRRAFLRPCSLMSGWICQWKPFLIPVGDSFQKAYLEEWIHMGDDSSRNLGEQYMANIPTMVQGAEYKGCTTTQKRPEEAPSAPRSSWQAADTPTWKISGIQGTASFWERAETPLPLPRPGCNLIHPKQIRPFPERLKLPFSSDEILSGRPIHYAGKDRP